MIKRRISIFIFLLVGLIACQAKNEAPVAPAGAEPTISSIFSVGDSDTSSDENFGSADSSTVPLLPTVQSVATPREQAIAAPVVREEDLIEEVVYDDAVSTNWLAGNVSGMQFDLESQTAVFEGKNAIALSPTADFGAFVLAVDENSDTIYYRDEVMGFTFQLYTGDQVFDPGNIAVSVHGSNDFTYHVREDDSVLGVGTGPVFPETRLYFLGFERELPADTWVDVEIWLDELLYDPDYDFVTALYLRNDEGYYNALAIDDVKIISLPLSGQTTLVQTADSNESITLKDVFVRQGPSVSDTLMTRLSSNTLVQIIEFEGDWAKITFDSNDGANMTGWVSRFEIRGGDQPLASTEANEATAISEISTVASDSPTTEPETPTEISTVQIPSTTTSDSIQPTEAPILITPVNTEFAAASEASDIEEDGEVTFVPLIPTPLVEEVLPTIEFGSGLPPTATPEYAFPSATPQPAATAAIDSVAVVDATETPVPLPICRTVDELASVVPTNIVTQGPWPTWVGEGKAIDYIAMDIPLLGLTFDAEGDPSTVRMLLDVLDKRQVKATFFIEGQWAQDNSALVTEMATRGHEFGNHSFSGTDPLQLSAEEIALELANTEAIVQALTDGQSTKPYYRPAFGNRNETTIQQAGDLGYFTMLWTAGSYDWLLETDTEEMCGNLMRDSFQGAIMLNHTHRPEMPEVIDRYVGEMQMRGYTFVPLSVMLAEDPQSLLITP